MTWRLFRRRRSRDERLDDELRYHVERQYDDYVRELLAAGGKAGWARGSKKTAE